MYIYEIHCTEGVTKSTRYQRGRVKIALRLYEDDVSGEGHILTTAATVYNKNKASGYFKIKTFTVG